MAKWSWQGLDRNGKLSSGVIDVLSQKDARIILKERGIKLKRLDPPSFLEFDITEWMTKKGLNKSFGSKELMLFTKQLSIMINAGVPILQTLETLFKTEQNPSLKSSIKRIAVDVKEGRTLYEAMEKQQGFDKLYCNLIRAGEASGALDNVLKKLTEYMERVEKIKSQIKSAMIYPLVVSCIGVAVVWLMMVFVVPQFIDMLSESGQEPPAITQFIISLSNFFNKYTIILIPSIILIIVFIKNYIQTESGKVVYDYLSMKISLFGNIIIKGNLTSFCRTLSILLNSGVPLIEALDICIETVSNKVIIKDLKTIRMAVEQGKNLTQSMSRIDYFPEILCQMIKVGEQTGQIDSILEKVSDILEDEVKLLIDTMTKLIEPVVIVVLGGIITFVLVGMYLPIFMASGGGVN